MRESQIHDALMLWLKKQGLFYVHSTFGKKATMTKDAPDFIILHCGKCLLLEIKTEKGAMTAGQTKKFAEIQRNSGMVVQIARTVEQSVSAVETWLGVETMQGLNPQRSGVPLDNERAAEVIASESTPDEGSLWIGSLFGVDYVFQGDWSAGSTAARLRRATPEDIRNFPRK
jgi:hypothetical protein